MLVKGATDRLAELAPYWPVFYYHKLVCHFKLRAGGIAVVIRFIFFFNKRIEEFLNYVQMTLERLQIFFEATLGWF